MRHPERLFEYLISVLLLGIWGILGAQPTEPPANCLPPGHTVRAMAEWEEVEYLVLTWTQFIPVLREVVRYAQTECKVLIICLDSAEVITDLQHHQVPIERVHFLQHPYNSIWVRDYGPNTVYDDQHQRVLLDWVYNRPRPMDDRLSHEIAQKLAIPYRSMSCPPHDLVHIGGNFVTDGQGIAFSSQLVVHDNGRDGYYTAHPKSEQEIDSLMHVYMGIQRYLKLPPLPYEVLDHLDMYMQLLDEETLLVGEYPKGIADGPQIEKNLLAIQRSVSSCFGTPYRVVRVPMPDFRGRYPGVNHAPYLTHTNVVFINRMVLVPIYDSKTDSIALERIRAALPGYRVVGINCRPIIMAGGALHCITRTIGVADPLTIVHQPHRREPQDSLPLGITAHITHTAGIQQAQVYYTTSLDSGFQSTPMLPINSAHTEWVGYLPAFPSAQNVYYYIEALAHSGKRMTRPLPAPEAYWHLEFVPRQSTFMYR